MQKKLIALAIAGLASSAAFAQTNVTIYGIVDVAGAYSWGGGNGGQYNVESGGLSGSRLGFKGVEDLGNGLKALFTLEYNLAVDQGSSIGTARQQFVGLTGGFGTFVAGRLQTAGYDFGCGATPLPGSALNALDKVITNGTRVGNVSTLLKCGGLSRAENAVAYISPSFGGFTVALNHARLSESSGSTAEKNDGYATLLSGAYKNGGLDAQVLYTKINGSQASAAVTAQDVAEYGVRASYNFGVASVYGSWQGREITTLDGDAGKLNQAWNAAVAVPFGKHTVIGQYAGNRVASTAAKDNASAYTLAYTYALSKRTTAYAGYTFVDNDSAATVAAGFDGVQVAGKSSQVIATGLRHSF